MALNGHFQMNNAHLHQADGAIVKDIDQAAAFTK